MERMAELAGEIAAHAVWSVSEGGPLTPIHATETAKGDRQLNRIVSERLEQAVENARLALKQNESGAAYGVTVFDGYYQLPSGRTDALYLEMRRYGPEPVSVTMAVPYRNAESEQGFAVFKLKLLELSIDQSHINGLVEAFWRGVDSHEQGAAVWNAHLDQSQ